MQPDNSEIKEKRSRSPRLEENYYCKAPVKTPARMTQLYTDGGSERHFARGGFGDFFFLQVRRFVCASESLFSRLYYD